MVKSVFALLDARLQKKLNALGFQQPTPIQQQAIPRILKGETLLLIAPTGHGKTEAAFLPLLHSILTNSRAIQGIQLLWITPLRALNRDILRRLVLIAQELKVQVEVRHGDTKAAARRRQMLQPPKLLVTTPETLQAVLAGPRMRENLRNIQSVVIDEIHELGASKRGIQLMVALERLRELTKAHFQRIGLSATVGNPQKISQLMTGEHSCSIIESPATKEFQFRLEFSPLKRDKPEESPLDEPAKRIFELIRQHKSTLVFCNERQTAEALALRLAKISGDDHGVHHGSLSRQARVEAEQLFKAGKVPYLVCTSSLELGLDIGTVDLVIQFGSPRQVVRLLQRVGRSGHRLHGLSKGIILATKFDDVCESLIIARHAREGKLEMPPIHHEALDILAHQLVGLAIEYKTIEHQRAYEIIRRAAPYTNLTKQSFHQVLYQLERENLITNIDERLRPRRRAYSYYFENLSVIPDTPQYEVVNLVTGRGIGRLDAGFAEEFGYPDSILVLRGRPWEVVKQDDDQLFVTPISQTKGKIPRWAGELIPVSANTAQAVGRLWAAVTTRNNNTELITSELEISQEARDLIPKTVKTQLQQGFLPDDKTIFVEVGPNFVVVHSCFGTKINETLGRLLSAIVTARLGIDLAYHADHYRILFRFIRKEALAVDEAIVEGLRTLDPDHMKDLLEITLLRSPYFARRFLHIARRFGIISKDADLRSTQLLRLMRYFIDTPAIHETLQEFFVDKLDLTGAKILLEDLRTQKIRLEIIYRQRPSKFARLILSRFGEFLEPEIPEAFIIAQTKKRLESRRAKLICLHCAQWSSVRTIKHLDAFPKCPKCNSRLIAGVFPTDELLEAAIRHYRAGMKLSPEENKALRKGRENANLVLDYGKVALMVMAGRGIGPTVAKRILAATHGRSDQRLFKKILESEKQFIRTREWWADNSPEKRYS